MENGKWEMENDMIEAIFFDFNGIIIDDERLHMTAYQQVLSGHDVTLTEAQYFAGLGMDDVTFARTALERAGKLNDELVRAVLDAKTALYRKMIEDDLPVYSGLVNFLKDAARHFSLGVVSMANKNEIKDVLDRARLNVLFALIVSCEDVSACKPAPDCYLRALENLNEQRRMARLLPLLANECLVVEDSPPGIESGRMAGMRTLGVTNTVSEADLRAAGADVVTKTLADWNADAVRHVFN